MFTCSHKNCSDFNIKNEAFNFTCHFGWPMYHEVELIDAFITPRKHTKEKQDFKFSNLFKEYA
jgi:hypothetical protein